MFEEQLDFSDVLIKPRMTSINSRKEVRLERFFSFKYSNHVLEFVPIMASNMDTIGTMDVMKVLSKYKVFTVLNKFITTEDICLNKTLLMENIDLFAFSIGMSMDDIEKLKHFNDFIKFKVICIDVANGYMNGFVEFCAKVRSEFPDKIIIAGNVVCSKMVQRLIKEGKVDIVKVGIGGGSACTTRLKTGVGRPQLSTVIDCAKAAEEVDGMIISDGGITCPGDAGKAFGAGAHMVMIGGQFSGHEENPGDVIEEEGKKFKLFYGMSSALAIEKHFGGHANYRTSEGRVIKIPFKGKLSETVDDYLGGIRSLCAYTNSHNISELQNNVSFYKVHNQVNKSLVN